LWLDGWEIAEVAFLFNDRALSAQAVAFFGQREAFGHFVKWMDREAGGISKSPNITVEDGIGLDLEDGHGGFWGAQRSR
jgi:hypothetical protein